MLVISSKLVAKQQIITLLHVSTLSWHPQTVCNQYIANSHQYFKCSCWQYNSVILYSDQQMHKIISQIITLLHVSTLPCHPQTACNQYLAKSHQYFTCSCWQYNSVISYSDQQMHTIISQIITLLHVSTLPCNPHTACNQHLAKSHQYSKCSCWQYSLQLRCFTQVLCKFSYYSLWNLNIIKYLKL